MGRYYCLGVAIFHTLIFSVLYRLKFENRLFFVLNPTLILVAAWVYRPLGVLVFLCLFASVFLLVIIGLIYNAILKSKDLQQFKKVKTPFGEIVLKIVLGIVFITCFPIICSFCSLLMVLSERYCPIKRIVFCGCKLLCPPRPFGLWQ